MASLPLGAARQHPVDPTLLNYKSIEGLEYIETRPLEAFPRSVAYRKCEDGGQMRVRNNSPEILDVDLTEEQARTYIAAIVEAGIFAWRRVYRPAQGIFAMESVNWRLEVTFTGGEGGSIPRPFRVEGENVFPDTYQAGVGALMQVPDGAE